MQGQIASRMPGDKTNRTRLSQKTKAKVKTKTTTISRDRSGSNSSADAILRARRIALRNKRIMASRHVQQVLFERRVLMFVTLVTGLGVLTFLVALSTDYWIVVIAEPVGGLALKRPEINYLWSHSGLWRKCVIYTPVEEDAAGIGVGGDGDGDDARLTRCEYHPLKGDDRDNFADIVKAEVAICILVSLLITLASVFSVYSIIHPRYTFKRVSAALHFMTGVALLILMEMVKSEGHLAQHDLDNAVLKQSTVLNGYSFLLAWIVLIIFFMSSFAFLLFSKKRKMMAHDYDQMLK